MGMDTNDLIIRSLDEELVDFDDTVSRTSALKADVVSRTQQLFHRFNPDDVNLTEPSHVAAFAQAANTVLKAIDAQEITATRKVTAKLKLQESRRQDDVSAAVTNLYQLMKDGKYNPQETVSGTLEEDMSSLDSRYTAADIGEIPETELRRNPDNLS